MIVRCNETAGRTNCHAKHQTSVKRNQQRNVCGLWLRYVQGRTLHFLLAHTKIDIFQKDIEEEFGLRPPTATALLKELEQRGLIRKEPVPYDARKKKIVVTEEALQYKDCVLKGLEELNQKLTAGISDEEMQVFFSVTDRMLKNLAK